MNSGSNLATEASLTVVVPTPEPELATKALIPFVSKPGSSPTAILILVNSLATIEADLSA